MNFRNNTKTKLRIVINAIAETESGRDPGMAFKEMTDKSLSSYMKKIRKDTKVLNIGVAYYCKNFGIPWKKEYKLENVCKTVAQLAWLANELKYFIEHQSIRNLEPTPCQLEFQFN